jgi:hypothetical protein
MKVSAERFGNKIYNQRKMRTGSTVDDRFIESKTKYMKE